MNESIPPTEPSTPPVPSAEGQVPAPVVPVPQTLPTSALTLPAPPSFAFVPPPSALPNTPSSASPSALPGMLPETPSDEPVAPKKPARARSGSGVLIAAVLAAALVGGAVGFGGGYLGASLAPGSSPAPIAGPSVVTVNNPDAVGETTVTAAKVLPSVVTLEVRGELAAGSGSGVALSSELIITNAHVVSLDGERSTPSIRVTTSDGRLLDATIVGVDPIYDIAVIRAEGAGLTPIEFADSTVLNVGDSAMAIGAPLGLPNSVTTGIISALDRSISIASSAAPETPRSDEDEEEEAPFEFRFPGQDSSSASAQRISIAVIQTDAAINPGNSGGALVNSEGRLIGINVAIATTGSGSEAGSIGLGFAIPSNIAHRVASELIENGVATHGLLGAMVLPASAVEGTPVAGAYISELVPGGPGEKAGLAAGDIVTIFNGVPITNANDLTAQVRALAAGSQTSLSYVRDGQSHTITVTLGALAL